MILSRANNANDRTSGKGLRVITPLARNHLEGPRCGPQRLLYT